MFRSHEPPGLDLLFARLRLVPLASSHERSRRSIDVRGSQIGDSLAADDAPPISLNASAEIGVPGTWH